VDREWSFVLARDSRLATPIRFEEGRQAMTAKHDRSPNHTCRRSGVRRTSRHLVETIRRAFAEFLTIPTLVIGGFLLLAVVTYFLDRAHIAREGPTVGLVNGILFSDPQSVSGLLGVIAAGVITLASITFALLLIAVQQGAAALTSQVFDQFLRRRANQFYFGFFIGLALYALIILATSSPSHTPVYGVAFAFLMTVVTLYLLILLIYTTIDQMRPVMIIQAIRDHTLFARESQLHLLQNTRRSSQSCRPVAARVTADRNGFLVRVDIAAVAKVTAKAPRDVEIVILASIGDYVTLHDVIAEIKADVGEDASTLGQVVRTALVLEEQRDLGTDPAFGIEQLLMIGWTSISTAKSNPQPGLLVCQSLRYILACWFEPGDHAGSGSRGAVVEPPPPVVYRDNVPEQVIKTFESLAVVASESMQHQSLAEILRTFAVMFWRLPVPLQKRAEDMLLRSLSALGEHVPTSDLDESLSEVIAALTEAGRSGSAGAIRAAQQQLRMSIGRLNSRSTRAAPDTLND
jgi:Predicted membrane protein (DUF2254)